jgi:hypothetical protein
MVRLFLVEGLEARRLLSTTLAVVGDFSADDGSGPVQGVSNLVKSWSPSDVITVGDNNYPDGAASTIDSNIGQWYQQYISPYKGTYGPGSADGQNHFWPALGNHDWNTGTVKPYTDYFTLPNNERYYAKQVGNVGIFVVDSDSHEPDGTSATSTQANWIKNAMLASTAKWKLVFFHHPAYSSGGIGTTSYMQWPFKSWGATAVFSGHDHDYERLSENGLTYFVNGLGGETIVGFASPIPGSIVRFDGDYGAMRLDATDSDITFQFITQTGKVIDRYTIADSTTPSNNNDLIPAGAVWKYLDNGSNQGTAWRASSFDDSTWKSGAAQLGYGDGDEATVVGYGPNSSSKYITTYFRKSFSVSDPSTISGLQLNLVRDDGAVVYLNGTEVFRSNMPSGTISSSTLAASTVGDVEESAWYPATINPALLQAGNNVIAVEIHQSAIDSSDISFDLQLSATTGQTTPMKPAAPTNLAATAASTSQINLAWQNNANNQSGFKIERSTDGVTFTQIASVGATVFAYSDTGRTAGTKYYYRVRATNSVGDSDYSNIASATTFPAGNVQTWVSDLTWTSATNGYKQVQKDKSNRGNPITIRRTVYAKGLGVHAVSQITYNLAGGYSTFVSDVGLDDEVIGGTGAVTFQVLGDGVNLFTSGVLTTNSAVVHVNVSVAGVKTLTLKVTNAVANTIDYDHADWAGAYLLTGSGTTTTTTLRTATTTTTKKKTTSPTTVKTTTATTTTAKPTSTTTRSSASQIVDLVDSKSKTKK